jgi:G:T-mismatch repair DNA endonuclease (very short patch repair protein)
MEQFGTVILNASRPKKKLCKIIVKDVWEKDLRNSEYLRTQGFIVLRFWEREIMSDIQKCLETILEFIAERST